MHEDLTHSQKLRRDTSRRRLLRQLVVLAVVGVALFAAWSVLSSRIFFLASVNGVVQSKEIKRVTVNRGGERRKESRYLLVIRDARGDRQEFEVAHDVFVRIEEGASVSKRPFSTQFSLE